VTSPHVLVLQHIAPETPGLVGRALEARQLAQKFVRPFEGEPIPRDLGDAAGLVVMGGPMGVYESERYPYLADEMRLIEQALRAGCPILGICLGSQLLASVLGSSVAKGKQKEIGWHRITLTADAFIDPLFKGLESSFIGLHWHGDIFDLPRSAISLASSELTQHQAFRHGASAYGLLCHMEATREIVEGMVRSFPEELAEVNLTARAVLEGADEHLPALSDRGSRVFGTWADLVLARSPKSLAGADHDQQT
jgi:GMP synthase (glutamine-hydrolysing)